MTFNVKKYYVDRYKNDSEYRKRQIIAIQAWQLRNPKKIKQYRKNQVERYTNRTPAEKRKRSLYLKKLRVKQKRKRNGRM